MSATPAATLARLKVQHGRWRIQATETGYRAERDGEVIESASLVELETELSLRG